MALEQQQAETEDYREAALQLQREQREVAVQQLQAHMEAERRSALQALLGELQAERCAHTTSFSRSLGVGLRSDHVD